MIQWIHVAASAGVLISCAATGVFLATVFFGDWFLKSDETLRKVMDFVMYAILAALAIVAFVVAFVAYRVCPLTPSTGI